MCGPRGRRSELQLDDEGTLTCHLCQLAVGLSREVLQSGKGKTGYDVKLSTKITRRGAYGESHVRDYSVLGSVRKKRFE
jgi:hypothetical protein